MKRIIAVLLTLALICICGFPIFAEETEKPEDPVGPQPYSVEIETYTVRDAYVGYTTHGYPFSITATFSGTRHYNSGTGATVYYDSVNLVGVGIDDDAGGNTYWANVTGKNITGVTYSGHTATVRFTVTYEYKTPDGLFTAAQNLAYTLD